MKKDKFRRIRGGSARILNIHCATCSAWVMKYQKDGPGALMRAYLNRIFAPAELEKLQRDPTIKQPADMPNLVCSGCKTLIGTPMRHHDGRLAFRLIKGKYTKKIDKGE
jgi:hypothetical protein